MSELSPKAKSILEAARRNHGPSDEDRDRVLMGLHTALGIGAVIPTLADTTTAHAAGQSGPQLISQSVPPPPPVDAVLQAAAQPASSGLGWGKLLGWKAGKIYLASLVVGGAATVSMVPRAQVEETVQARKSAAVVAPAAREERVVQPQVEAVHERVVQEAKPVEPAVQAQVAERVVDAPVLDAPRTEAALDDAPVNDAPSIARATVRTTRHRAHRHTHVTSDRALLALDTSKPEAPAEVAAPAQPVAPPAPELALIRRALTSLRDRDPQQALALLDEHAQRFANGAFVTERRGLHAIALCAAGRYEEGAREREQFLKSAGDSPIAARVRAACPKR